MRATTTTTAATTTSEQIWQITTRMPDPNDSNKRLKQFQTYSIQKVGENAIQINAKENRGGMLAIWMTLQLSVAQGSNEDRLVPGRQKGFIYDVWALISSFGIGTNHEDIFSSLNQFGSYALCLKNPASLRPQASGLFPVITIHPDHVVEAVLRGDFKMVSNIIKANPDILLKPGTAIDLSGR